VPNQKRHVTQLRRSRANLKNHWEKVYARHAPETFSWFRPHLDASLSIIERIATPSSSIIDVGGGESTLADDLLSRGYHNITVLDISETALAVCRDRLGPNADRIHWLLGDVTKLSLNRNSFDLWHDRAVFHFLTKPDQRAHYVKNVARSVKHGGHVIVGTFGPEGPQHCSGLDVMRYSAGKLHNQFGSRFKLVDSFKELHKTPLGITQQFLYCYCRME
jgi:ubiquinone/menaquinone biosynthesis C-methylase UbiE